jgi:hypothetical protein
MTLGLFQLMPVIFLNALAPHLRVDEAVGFLDRTSVASSLDGQVISLVKDNRVRL